MTSLSCEASPFALELGTRRYDLSMRALIMGIVNRTPDSFFDHGAFFTLDAAISRTAELVASGADIIDVGGVRAGPGPAVTLTEEIDRVVPVVEAIGARFDVAISVDTWNSQVAKAAFSAGAVLGNDISGFADPDYLAVAAKAGASVVATHIRLAPRVDDPIPNYPGNDVVAAVESFLLERRAQALRAGIAPTRIIFDAGLDLGKNSAQSLELLRASDRLVALGQPVLLSTSNKGFLGELLSLGINDRRDATLSAVAFGVALGCRIVRVHDVRGARRVVNTLSAVVGA